MKISNEAKVGLLLLTTLILTLVFAWFLGAHNPFKNSVSFYVTYNFAGGIEVGSPVRVAGIKVGKVEKIEFFTPEASFQADSAKENEILTPLKLKISISKESSVGVRKDSEFYINLAGIIGERYVEITPGTTNAAPIEPGEMIRGIDPPRIDQLISQSFNLAGKITEIIKQNEGDITKTIKLLLTLSSNINKTLEHVDKSKMFKTDIAQLINNLIEITSDVKDLTAKTKTAEGKKALKLLHDLLMRLEPLDKDAIKQFLQKEGIRARLF